MTDAARIAATEISRHFFGTNLGWGLTLDEIIDYRNRLQFLGVDCNRSWRHLTEGFYPIDLTEVALEGLVEHPFELDDLFGEPRPYGGYDGRAVLAFLAVNSD